MGIFLQAELLGQTEYEMPLTKYSVNSRGNRPYIRKSDVLYQVHISMSNCTSSWQLLFEM